MQSVLDRFGPYETTVDIELAEALTDTNLAAAFPMHTAAPSPNPNGNKLDEITEDAEEASSPRGTAHLPSPVLEFPMPTRKASTERWPSRRPQLTQPLMDASKAPTPSQKSSVAKFLVTEESGHQSITQLETPTISKYEPSDVPSETSIEDAASNLNGKSEYDPGREAPPAMALNEQGEIDFDKYYADVFKTKVRLGPRLVTVPDRSKASQRSSVPFQPRAVSTLPKTVQTKVSSPDLSQTAVPVTAPPMLSLFPRPPAIPEEPQWTLRPSSRSSIRSLPQSTMSIKTSRSTMTPEKQRLMKAMELRKKQMKNSSQHDTVPDVVPTSEQSPPVPTIDTVGINKNELSNQVHEKTDSGVQLHFEPPTENVGLTPETSRAATSPAQNPDHDAGALRAPAFPPRSSDSLTLGNVAAFSGCLARSPAIVSLVTSRSPTNLTDSHPEQVTPRSSNDTSQRQNIVGAVVPETETADEAVQKRRQSAAPLALDVDLDAGTGDDHEHSFQSDDEFLEELHSATFEEATPISYSRSPASPYFPRMPSYRSEQSSLSIKSISGASLVSTAHKEQSELAINGNSTTKPTREFLPRSSSLGAVTELVPVSSSSVTTVRNEATALGAVTERIPVSSSSVTAVRNVTPGSVVSSSTKPTTELLAPGNQIVIEKRPRSSASATTVGSENSDPAAVPRNRSVSSGIAKRMQALAEKTAREANNTPSRALPDKNPLVSMRHATLQNVREAKPVERKPANRFSVWPNVTLNQSANCDSVSVTARIVRQSDPENSSKANGSDPEPVTVSQTPLMAPPECPPVSAISDESVPEAEHLKSKKVTDPITSPALNFATGDSERQRHSSTASVVSDDLEKSSSRTSRFFRRMSNIGGSKKSQRGPSLGRAASVTESSAVSSATSSRPATRGEAKARAPATKRSGSAVRSDSVPDIPDIPPPIVVGDMNIQFPGTMLWKRRWVEIDHAGNMLFTTTRPENGRSIRRGFVTKFHLKELMRPYVPEVDRQEMPHCVLFDLPDGAKLSCSSEDSMAQRQLLSRECFNHACREDLMLINMAVLSTYHQAWNGKDA